MYSHIIFFSFFDCCRDERQKQLDQQKKKIKVLTIWETETSRFEFPLWHVWHSFLAWKFPFLWCASTIFLANWMAGTVLPHPGSSFRFSHLDKELQSLTFSWNFYSPEKIWTLSFHSFQNHIRKKKVKKENLFSFENVMLVYWQIVAGWRYFW